MVTFLNKDDLLRFVVSSLLIYSPIVTFAVFRNNAQWAFGVVFIFVSLDPYVNDRELISKNINENEMV